MLTEVFALFYVLLKRKKLLLYAYREAKKKRKKRYFDVAKISMFLRLRILDCIYSTATTATPQKKANSPTTKTNKQNTLKKTVPSPKIPNQHQKTKTPTKS